MQRTDFLTLAVIAVASFLPELEAWAPTRTPISSRALFRSSSSSSASASASLIVRQAEGGSESVESISVANMGDNHEAVGEDLAGSVQRWLDAEWMPQEVHVQMGQSCKRTYMTCREEGEVDLMALMMQTADDLNENWGQYDKDAFVNAYDISNYVSDYFTNKAGVEGCECLTKIY
jgi:hypothetical protein